MRGGVESAALACKPATGYTRAGEAGLSPMIGLSVAIGRFVEALFWAILRVAGTVTAAVFAAAIVLAAGVVLLKRWHRKRAR